AFLIVLAVVIQAPVDVHAIGDGVRAERMVVPDHDVGVLAGFERANSGVDAKLLCGVDVTSDRASSSVRPPHFIDLAASVFKCRASSASSELIEETTPSRVIRAAFYGMASIASIL